MTYFGGNSPCTRFSATFSCGVSAVRLLKRIKPEVVPRPAGYIHGDRQNSGAAPVLGGLSRPKRRSAPSAFTAPSCSTMGESWAAVRQRLTRSTEAVRGRHSTPGD